MRLYLFLLLCSLLFSCKTETRPKEEIKTLIHSTHYIYLDYAVTDFQTKHRIMCGDLERLAGVSVATEVITDKRFVQDIIEELEKVETDTADSLSFQYDTRFEADLMRIKDSVCVTKICLGDYEGQISLEGKPVKNGGELEVMLRKKIEKLRTKHSLRTGRTTGMPKSF